MKKFITANLVAITSLIGTLIIGLSSIAWTNEKKLIYNNINAVKITSNMQDSLIWNEFGNHKATHKDEEKQRIERDVLMYKYLESEFGGIETLIKQINKN